MPPASSPAGLVSRPFTAVVLAASLAFSFVARLVRRPRDGLRRFVAPVVGLAGRFGILNTVRLRILDANHVFFGRHKAPPRRLTSQDAFQTRFDANAVTRVCLSVLTPPRLIPVLILACLIAQTAVAAAPRRLLLARDRTEPVVAVNPTNPSIILAASNTNYDAPIDNTYPPALFISRNGGRTFGFKPAPLLSPYTTGADPSAAIAGSGTM